MEELNDGLYESLLTQRLQARIHAAARRVPDLRAIDAAEQPEVLARHLRDAALRSLTAQRDPAKRIELVNELLAVLEQQDDVAVDDLRQLMSLVPPAGPGVASVATTRQATALSDAALLTNARGKPSLGTELRAELVRRRGGSAVRVRQMARSADP